MTKQAKGKQAAPPDSEDLAGQLTEAGVAGRAMTPLKPWSLKNRLDGFDQTVSALRRQLAGLRRDISALQDDARSHSHGSGEPAFRNGVHIDEQGRYWMRADGEWYPMVVLGSGARHATHPRQPYGRMQRLVEPPKPRKRRTS